MPRTLPWLVLLSVLSLTSAQTYGVDFLGLPYDGRNLCEELVLGDEVVAVTLDLLVDDAVASIVRGEDWLRSRTLAFGRDHTLIFVAQAFTRFHDARARLLVLRDGVETWSTGLRLRHTSSDEDMLHRVAVGTRVPRELWPTLFPEPGLYELRLEPVVPEPHCGLAASSWVLAGDATR